MAKKYVLGFGLGLLIGLGSAALFLRQPTKVASAPTAVVCPTCPVCDQVVQKEAKLPPPTFELNNPEFIGDDDGEIIIKFKPVKGAMRNRLTVFDQRGGRVRTFSTKENYVRVKDVPCPPDRKFVTYTMALSSMSLLGQEGEFGEKRKLTIKGRPELYAPTIKAITVED